MPLDESRQPWVKSAAGVLAAAVVRVVLGGPSAPWPRRASWPSTVSLA
jgi:hypothetical protein